jgi:hypothetical protein
MIKKMLTIKNSQVATLLKILGYDMPFAQGRMRNRFFNLVKDKFDEYEKNRIEICQKFAEKDKNGEYIMKDGSFTFPKDTEVYKEIEALQTEDCKIDFPMSLMSDIGGIKALIELSTVVLTPLEVIIAEDILDAFNHISSTPEEDQPENTGGKHA